jgi:hypothetical protein
MLSILTLIVNHTVHLDTDQDKLSHYQPLLPYSWYRQGGVFVRVVIKPVVARHEKS